MKTSHVWTISPAKPNAMALKIDRGRREGLHTRFTEQREILSKVFPRGRFRMAEDGRCVLVTNRQDFGDNYVFLHSPTSIGVYWNTHYVLLTDALKGLIRSQPDMTCLRSPGEPLDIGEEGIFYLRACQALAGVLPWFSRRQPSNPAGIGLVPRRPGILEGENDHGKDQDAQERGSDGGTPPPEAVLDDVDEAP